MNNQVIDFDLYKPLINYKYSYSGGVTLYDNRLNPENSRIRYQNSNAMYFNTNPVNYNGVSYNLTYLNRFYFQDAGLMYLNRFRRDGEYSSQKVYFRLKKDFLTTTSFVDGDILYFVLRFYKRSELDYEQNKNFYLESMDQSTFGPTLGDVNNYNRYAVLDIPFSQIIDLDYLEIDLKSFRFDYENDPDWYKLFQIGIDINIYELRLCSFYRPSTKSYVYLQNITGNDNLTFYKYNNKFSEYTPKYESGVYNRIGSTVGSNNFYLDIYDREYLINNSTAYTIYKTSTIRKEMETFADNWQDELKIQWINGETVDTTTGLIDYSDNLKITPNAEAVQKDSNNNIKRIFWRFDVSKDTLKYYGKIMEALLVFNVDSVENNNFKAYPLNYVVRYSSLPQSKYQSWMSNDVDNETLNEMYNESTVLYNNDQIFGGNGDIDGSATYCKTPNCIINPGYYFTDVTGNTQRSNYRGGDYSDRDYRRRLGGVFQIENYSYINPSIKCITIILEDVYPSTSHTYVKTPLSENLYFGVSRYSTYPVRKYISSLTNTTHSKKPFLMIGVVYPSMKLIDENNIEIPTNYLHSVTINAGETPPNFKFYIENIGRGLLYPTISKSGDDSNVFINAMVKTENKAIANKLENILSIDEKVDSVYIEEITVSFKQLNTPGRYSGVFVVSTEPNTYDYEQIKQIEFEFIVNTVNELKISTTEPDPTKIFIDPEYIPEITTTLDMEFTYGDTSTKSYDIYSWNSGAGNLNVILNKFYDTFDITHLDPYNSLYRYSPYDFDPFYFTNSQGTGRYFYVTDSAVFNYKINVNVSCFVDQLQPNILNNGDISVDNWPLKNDCSTIAGGLRSTYLYQLNSSDSYSSVTTPSFNLNANKFYRFDLYLRKAGLGFDNSKISIKLLDSSNNVLKDLTPTISMWSNSLGYSMIKFVYYSDLNYTNCKILFENTNTKSSRTLYIESACVKECKPLPPGTYTGYLEFWNYDNVNPNENKVYIKYNLTINPRTGYQESAGVLFL